jgi:Integral membrane protein DUF92
MKLVIEVDGRSSPTVLLPSLQLSHGTYFLFPLLPRPPCQLWSGWTCRSSCTPRQPQTITGVLLDGAPWTSPSPMAGVDFWCTPWWGKWRNTSFQITRSDGTIPSAYYSHFACCLGDTLASELGILSRSPPVLVTTFKRVPPGTNGAMSVGGTVASILGGGFIGLIAGLSFVLENVKCAESASAQVLSSIVWGMLGGGFGSLVKFPLFTVCLCD